MRRMIIMVATMMTRQVDENDFAVEDEHSPIICRTSLESQASSSLCEVRQTEPTQLQLLTDQVRTQNRLPIRLPLHIAIKVTTMMMMIAKLVKTVVMMTAMAKTMSPSPIWQKNR